jgi:hydrogenase maturation protease
VSARGSRASIVVLGIGNVLWADEGFGVRCLEELARRYAFAPHVELIDGGTLGLYLIQHVQSAGKLLIFDAVDYGLAPGTLQLVEDREVPRFLGAKKLSLHQTGFQEVLALAELIESYPDEVLLVGCQPALLDDYGGSLTDVVRASIEQAIERAVERLAAWGAMPRPRAPEEPRTEESALALAAYEAGRPSAELACRIGDARFLVSRSAVDGEQEA